MVEGITDTPTVDWDEAQMMGLQTTGQELGVRSDEAKNSRVYERHESMKAKNEDQGDKMGRKENTGLMCQ